MNSNDEFSILEQQCTENKKLKKLPKIGDYRMRAHINIFSDTPFPQ